MIHISDRLQVLLANLFAQGMRVLSTLFLLRLIPPNQHGEIVIITSFTGLFASFGDFGLPRLLVRNRDWPEEQVRDTVSILLWGSGVAMLLVNAAAGWYLAWQENNPLYFWIAGALGLTALLTTLRDSQLALMSRRLAFRQEVRQQLLFAFAQAITGIVYAMCGFGIYTFALQPLTSQVIANIAIQRHEPLRWPRYFRWEIAKSCRKPMVQMGLAYYFAVIATPVQNLFYFRTAKEIAPNIDLAKSMVGYFGKCLQLRDMVTFNIIAAFDRLIFPLFSRDQHDPIRLRELFVRSAASVTVFVSFCGWGLIVTAPELVQIVAGPKWDPVNDRYVLWAICLPLIITTGTSAVSTFLCAALNRSYIWSVHSILLAALSAASYFVVQTDLAQLALGYAIAQMIASLFVIVWALRTLQLNPLVLLRRLMIPLAIGFVCGMTTMFLKTNFAGGAAWQRLLVTGTFFVALYAMTAWLFDRETVSELRRLVRRKQPEPKET